MGNKKSAPQHHDSSASASSSSGSSTKDKGSNNINMIYTASVTSDERDHAPLCQGRFWLVMSSSTSSRPTTCDRVIFELLLPPITSTGKAAWTPTLVCRAVIRASFGRCLQVLLLLVNFLLTTKSCSKSHLMMLC
jgi:hypothetical protein